MLNVQPVLLQVVRVVMRASQICFSVAAIGLLLACAAPAHCRELKQAAASGGLPGLPRLLVELEMAESSLRAQLRPEVHEKDTIGLAWFFSIYIAKPITLRTAHAVTSSIFKTGRASRASQLGLAVATKSSSKVDGSDSV